VRVFTRGEVKTREERERGASKSDSMSTDARGSGKPRGGARSPTVGSFISSLHPAIIDDSRIVYEYVETA